MNSSDDEDEIVTKKLKKYEKNEKKNFVDMFESKMNKSLNEESEQIITMKDSRMEVEKHDKRVEENNKQNQHQSVDSKKKNEKKYEFDSSSEDEDYLTRHTYTNDELLYDPNMDDEDQDWINSKRKTLKPFFLYFL